ncbi:MAG: hypothetical protein DHS20C14_15910 [Phycisphaeraceae bacterium]|nr:MAG: hypothetical protein DHS20C14_15910 [Phycisphaeraceae bacterium]
MLTPGRVLILLGVVAALLGPVLGGCVAKKTLFPPTVLIAPYDTSEGESLWAVIPPRNESGTSVVDERAVGDAIVQSVQATRGLRCLPLNRTIEAMRALKMENGVQTPADAEQLAITLGCDGIVAGSITAYDPYEPPTMGLSLALYARPGALTTQRRDVVDPYQLTRSFTDTPYVGSNFKGTPVTVASEILDARDHSTLMAVQDYAEGRSDKQSALGWRVHLASMDLYTKFAAHQTVRRLLDEEWLRLAREVSRQNRSP